VDAPAPSQLLRVSQGLSTSATVTTESIFAAIDMNKAGILSKDETSLILKILEKVAKGQLQATDSVRKLNALSEADRTNLSAIMTPILNAVNEGLTQVEAMNPTARSKAQALLLAVQSTLAIVDAALKEAK
jgi:hypothetical protein